jgi:hypothetical protein
MGKSVPWLTFNFSLAKDRHRLPSKDAIYVVVRADHGNLQAAKLRAPPPRDDDIINLSFSIIMLCVLRRRQKNRLHFCIPKRDIVIAVAVIVGPKEKK